MDVIRTGYSATAQIFSHFFPMALHGNAAENPPYGSENIFSIDHHYRSHVCKTVDKTLKLQTRYYICKTFLKPRNRIKKKYV